MQRSRQGRSIEDRNAEAPVSGIYYIVRYPAGWVPLTWVYESGLPHMDHPEFWEHHVAPLLAAKWAAARKTTPARLEESLRLHTYAFPRGRITIYQGIARVLHGTDAIPRMRFSRAAIESEFNLVEPLWEDDEHEHCHEDDKEAVRRLLSIKEDWAAV
ncbi:MAG: hypothetical protein ABL974_01105 [Prosthecobacter sp.]